MAEHRYIGNARGKCTTNPQYLFKYGICDLMPRQPQAGSIGADLKGEQALARQNIVELVSNIEMIRAVGRHIAHDDVVVVEATPVVERNAGARVRLVDHVLAIHGAESAAAGEIIA